MFLFLFCKKLSIFQTTLEFSSFLCMIYSYVFFTHFPKKTKKNLLRVSRLFSTSRFCSDVTILVFFSCTLACHAGYIFHIYENTFINIWSLQQNALFQIPLHFPQFTKSQVNLLVCVSVQIFRMSTSWHTGWKVLNCLTNTTEITGGKANMEN